MAKYSVSIEGDKVVKTINFMGNEFTEILTREPDGPWRITSDKNLFIGIKDFIEETPGISLDGETFEEKMIELNALESDEEEGFYDNMDGDGWYDVLSFLNEMELNS